MIRKLAVVVLAAAAVTALGSQAPSPDTAAGEAVFFGKGGCGSCHEINGRGGVTGPDLSAAGTRTADAIRAKIVSPSSPPAGGGRGAAAPVTIVARTGDGREVQGVRRAEDTFSLQVVDASGALHVIDKMSAREIRRENRSLMPGDFAARLSETELQNLVAYLAALKTRDLSQTASASLPGGVSYDRLRNSAAEPQNWMHYWGDYQGMHFSRLKEITPANVSRLQARWSTTLAPNVTLETHPVVIDGVMIVTGPPGTVSALDAKTGRQIWSFTRAPKTRNPNEINPFNRGVAVLGNRVFVGTLDAALVALDARTGRQLWETQVADTMLGHSITSAPLVVKDKVIVGITGGEFGPRGFLDAYDAATGKQAWRFYAVPAPGEFGSDTWKGDSWKLGGSPMWLTGSYDPELNTLYWTVGNPGPQIDRSVRGDGDNLFSDSVVALDPDTGARKWHYQFTPNDGHDWDSTEDVVLVDRLWHGENRKLLLHADRNAMFYVIDRITGKLLQGTPFVYQNWNTGFDENGRPKTVPGWNSIEGGSFFVYPTLTGGTNFQAPSYSPETGLFYLAYAEDGQRYASAPAVYEQGRQYIGRGQASGPSAPGPGEPQASAGIKALDPESGSTVWDFKISQGSLSNGVMATAGGVLFASLREGQLAALDAATGKYLWRFQTGVAMAASPMSYAVDGRQYVAIAAGGAIMSFALPD